MATGTFKLFSRAGLSWDDKQIDWVADNIKWALMLNTWTPNQDTDDYWSDISGFEASGTGYTAGGQLAAGKSVSQSGNVLRFFCSDVVWSASSIANVTRVVCYKDTGMAATSPLIGWATLSGAETSASGNFTIDVDGTNGVFTWTVAT
jgi:hypothetical protein